MSSRSLRVAAFTGGLDVPSARFRVRQYSSALAGHGIELREFVARLGSYPPARRQLRAAWACCTVASRLPGVLRSHRYDVTLLQREMLSTMFTIEALTRAPRLLDVDDAIWIYRNGTAAKRLAEAAEGVICGNTFLAEQFARWNKRVFVVPTPVDTTTYVPLRDPGNRGRAVVGWIGTGGGLRFLKQIEPALASVLRRNPDARLRVISDMQPELRLIPGEQFEYVVWSRESEVTDLQAITVGLMPLDDSIWARGKCSYKMLTYMACGIPVVVSPVGMNSEVLARGLVGLPAETQEDWVESIEYLLTNREAAASMGQDGRRVVLQHFSITALAPLLARCLWSHSH